MDLPRNWREQDSERLEFWWQERLRTLMREREVHNAIALFEEFELEQKLNINNL